MELRVFVTDVVKGHLLAMEKGKVGEKYILGGENISMGNFFKLLEALSGINAPKASYTILDCKNVL